MGGIAWVAWHGWPGMEWHGERGHSGIGWHGMEWQGMAWHGIGLNYSYKEILNALKTKGHFKYISLLPYGRSNSRRNKC